MVGREGPPNELAALARITARVASFYLIRIGPLSRTVRLLAHNTKISPISTIYIYISIVLKLGLE